jgi:tetratricopeptide (TPR) repeat protein
MDKTSNKYFILLFYTALTLITLFAYEPLRHNDFISYDDGRYVTENPNVKAGITRQSILWAFTTQHAGNWHPLTWLSHMLDYQLFGMNARWHHMTSLLLHIINTVLLFFVLKKITAAIWRSAFVAAAFALHPLHVESVAWVAERKDVLSTLFWILTIAVYIRYVRRNGISWYILTILAFALGLMAKPMLVTLPFVLLLLDYWPLKRPQKNKRVIFRMVAEKIPLFLLTAISCILTLSAQQKAGAVNPIPLATRTAIAVISYASYISKMLWPSKPAMFYPLPESLNKILALVSAFSITGITIISVYWARRRPWFLVGWLWFLGTLVPVIGLVKVGAAAIADRYTYIPSVGFFIIIAWSIAEIVKKWSYTKWPLTVCVILVFIAWMLCARFQVGHWRNSTALYEHTISVTERNYIAHNNLGLELYNEGLINDAVEHFRKAAKFSPGLSEPYWHLADALAKQGRIHEAVSQATKASKFEPNETLANEKLGRFLFEQKKFEEAVYYFKKAAEIDTNSVSAHVNLAAALLQLNKFDEAIKHYQKALAINPEDSQAQNGLKTAIALRNRQ